MDNRNKILYQLQDDIKKNLTKLNGYHFTPAQIERGIISWNDVKSMPFIGFTFIREIKYVDEKYQRSYDDTDTRSISIMIYGYCKTDGYGKSDLIFEMCNDVELFLESEHNTKYNDTIINSIEIKEGGINDPTNSFLMDVSIIYDYKGIIHYNNVSDAVKIINDIE